MDKNTSIESRRVAAASKLVRMGDDFDKERFPDLLTEWRMAWVIESCTRLYNDVAEYISNYVNSAREEIET